MQNQKHTLKWLVEKSGAPPYIIKYLYSCKRLPVIRESCGVGYPVIFDERAVEIVKAHILRTHNERSVFDNESTL